MAESLLLTVFKVIWHDMLEDKTYNLMNKNKQFIQILINESEKNKQVSQTFAIALEKCYAVPQKNIASECREELIKKSTFSQYRGAKIYKPAENDRDIKNLENKLKSLETQLKQLSKQKSSISVSQLFTELSQANYQSFQDIQTNLDALLAATENDCNVNCYQTALRDDANGLRKQIFQHFLLEIDANEKLNQIFDTKTYLIVNEMFQKYKQK